MRRSHPFAAQVDLVAASHVACDGTGVLVDPTAREAAHASSTLLVAGTASRVTACANRGESQASAAANALDVCFKATADVRRAMQDALRHHRRLQTPTKKRARGG